MVNGQGKMLLVGASMIALLNAASAQAQSGPAQQTPAASQGLTEIIVTAQKREQRLQDVPVSITALSGQALTANRVQNVVDLNAIVPNVSIRETSGGDGIPGISMRGALSYGIGPGADREVGFYVDGVYVGYAIGSNFDLPDVDRIEVLRGPQGTLFGRNATAGAISIVTPDPKGKFDVHQDFTYGNYNQFRSKTRLDLPSFGDVSASIAFLHTERRGDTRNLGAGTQWNYNGAGGLGVVTSPKYLGDQNVNSLQAAIKYEPSSSFKVVYKFDWMHNDYTPSAMGIAAYGPGGQAALAGLLALQNPALMTPISETRPDAVNNGFTLPSHVNETGHNLTAQWRISDAVSLKNVFGYRKVASLASQELGGLGGIIYPGTTNPFLVLDSVTNFHHEQVSDEFQLNISTRPLTVTAGALYYHQKAATGGLVGVPNDYAFYLEPSTAQPYSLSCTGLPASSCAGAPVTRGTSYAGYIQAELHVTTKFDIVGGFRETHDIKSGVYPTSATDFGSFRVAASNPSYLVGANYHASRDLLLYAKYSTAFMSGGGNTGQFLPALQVYKPEKAYSWEAGVKSDLLDRHLRLNLSLFDVKYKDVQYVNGGSFCGDATAGVCVLNAGDARAKGFEFEATALPVRGLTLNAGVGYTHYQILSLSPAIQSVLASGLLNAYNANYRPDWTTNLSAQYDTPAVVGDAHLSFRLDSNYRSANVLAPDAPAAYVGVASNGGIWLLNGRVGLAGIDLAGGHKAEIAIWARNITNDGSKAFISTLGILYPTSYEQARTFGVDVSFKL